MSNSDLDIISVEILIPTYNRPKRAELQIQSLLCLKEMLNDVGFKLNVLVSDNHSFPPVKIPEVASGFTKIIKPEKHLPTAEENLFFGLSQTSSDYIWILGDDDAVIESSAFDMITSLRSKPVDLIISNTSGTLTNGDFVKSRTPCDYPDLIDGLPSFIKSTGFWFVTAGFSCLLVKRASVMNNLMISKEYFSTSRIYSHVFWLLDTFWDSSFKYFEKPIVIYGQNPTDVGVGDHWEKACLNEGVFHKFIWTLGFARHAKLLRRRKSIPRGYFSSVIDQNWSTRFHHLSQCMNVFIEILEAEAKREKTICRMITGEEKKEFLEFISLEDYRLIDIVATLSNSLDNACLSDIKVAKLMLQKFIGDKFYNCFFVKDFGGWNIYSFDGVYRAVPRGRESHYKMEFHNICPSSSSGHVVHRCLKEIESQIIAHKPTQNLAFASLSTVEDLSEMDLKLLKKLLRFIRKIKRFLPTSFALRL